MSGPRRRSLARAIASAIAVAVLGPSGAAAAPGDLDPTFGDAGVVTTTTAQGVATGAVAASGNRALVAGSLVNGSSWRIHRYRSDGSLDPDWSNDGRRTVTWSDSPATLDELLVHPDGRTLVAGHSRTDVLFLRLDTAGDLDASFGDGGRLEVPVPPDPAFGQGFSTFPSDVRLARLSSGAVIAAFAKGNTGQMQAVRISSAGVADANYGAGGVATTPRVNLGSVRPTAGLAGAGGTVLVVARARALLSETSGAVLARFTAAGTPDASFGGGGQVGPISFQDGAEVAGTIANQFGGFAGAVIGADQKITAFGRQTTGVGQSFAAQSFAVATRRLPGGAIDPSFAGGTGVRMHRLVPLPTLERLDTMARAADGKIVLAGQRGTANGALLARLTADGEMDPSFGPGAATPTGLIPGAASSSALPSVERIALQSNGRILAIDGRQGSFRIARFFAECTVILACLSRFALTPSNVASITGSVQVSGISLGILVQRVVGRRLVRVGRVPFGPRPRGRNRIAWSLKVGGRPLAPGVYLVTLRALNRKGKVIDLARPVRVTIRASHRSTPNRPLPGYGHQYVPWATDLTLATYPK